MSNSYFQFKQFAVHQEACGMKVGTDGVLLGAWAQGGQRMLDIGTGTGLVALMLAQRYKQSRVVGIEIDEASFQQAQRNVMDSPFASRVTVVHEALQQFSSEETFDSIVSNPPFFVDALRASGTSRCVARHTDTLSYADLFAGVVRLLSAAGCFSAIIPADCAVAFVAEGYHHGLVPTRRCGIKTSEYKPVKRYLLQFGRKAAHPLTEETVVMMTGGQRSPWYATLTNDFYVR